VHVVNLELCDVTIHYGYEDNLLDVIHGNIDNLVSLGYCSRYDASLDPLYVPSGYA